MLILLGSLLEWSYLYILFVTSRTSDMIKSQVYCWHIFIAAGDRVWLDCRDGMQIAWGSLTIFFWFFNALQRLQYLTCFVLIVRYLKSQLARAKARKLVHPLTTKSSTKWWTPSSILEILNVCWDIWIQEMWDMQTRGRCESWTSNAAKKRLFHNFWKNMRKIAKLF